jgi:membrane protein DedA with SNARE-associated domain
MGLEQQGRCRALAQPQQRRRSERPGSYDDSEQTMLPFLQQFLTTYGYLAVALGVMVERMGIPVPGETMLLLAAAYAGAGHLDVRGVIVAAALGAIVGDSIGYEIGRLGGRALLSRYGHRLHLKTRHLARAEAFFARHGDKTVFFGRFTAFLRTFSAFLAGVNRMPSPIPQ